MPTKIMKEYFTKGGKSMDSKHFDVYTGMSGRHGKIFTMILKVPEED
jgi:hypothetical protein